MSGSNVGGIAETQQMSDFCGTQNITADVAAISMNEAYEKVFKASVKCRFAMDTASLRSI